MNPTPKDMAVVDPVLTNMSVAWMQRDNAYIADRVFPVVPVSVQGGKYRIYDRGDWLRSTARVRAPGTESAGGGWRVSSAGFFIDIIAVHKDVDDPTATVAASDAGGNQDLKSDASDYVSEQLRLKQDIQWVSAYFQPGVWSLQATGVAAAPAGGQFLRWSTAGSTPITDVKTQQLGFRRTTGYPANTLVFGPDVWLALTEHASILSRIQYVERGIVTTDVVGALWDLPVDRIFVAYAIQNNATEGAADNFDFIAGKHALLAYAAPRPSLLQPSAGYTFAWTAYPGTANPTGADRRGAGVRVSDFRMEWLKSDRVEGEYASSPYIVSSELGFFFSGAVV